jgi:hypothetical protein
MLLRLKFLLFGLSVLFLSVCLFGGWLVRGAGLSGAVLEG